MGGLWEPEVDVLIPVYRPGERFGRLLERLWRQSYGINRVIVVNTGEEFWDEERFGGGGRVEVHHVTKEEFDHGGTRNLAAGYSDAEVMIFMTDDALPRDRYLVENLVRALGEKGPGGETVAMAYARQLPDRDCRPVERLIRRFNYPGEGRVKTLRDLPELGIRTFFASNSCCGYRRKVFDEMGGFISRAIFNEDMIYAAGVIKGGYAVAYEPKAKVIHSHNMTLVQQFRRNFDLAVSQADHPEVFGGVPSEGEGIRMVGKVGRWLVQSGQAGQIPRLIAGSGGKYLGYRLGKLYRRLPKPVILKCTMNREYWERRWRDQT